MSKENTPADKDIADPADPLAGLSFDRPAAKGTDAADAVEEVADETATPGSNEEAVEEAVEEEEGATEEDAVEPDAEEVEGDEVPATREEEKKVVEEEPVVAELPPDEEIEHGVTEKEIAEYTNHVRQFEHEFQDISRKLSVKEGEEGAFDAFSDTPKAVKTLMNGVQLLRVALGDALKTQEVLRRKLDNTGYWGSFAEKNPGVPVAEAKKLYNTEYQAALKKYGGNTVAAKAVATEKWEAALKTRVAVAKATAAKGRVARPAGTVATPSTAGKPVTKAPAPKPGTGRVLPAGAKGQATASPKKALTYQEKRQRGLYGNFMKLID